MTVRFAQEARNEFVRAVDWYAREAGPAQAKAFATEILRIIRLLTSHPGMGAPAASGLRRMPVHRFPYDIVYRHDAETLRIIAVSHQRRRPTHWTGRR